MEERPREVRGSAWNIERQPVHHISNRTAHGPVEIVEDHNEAFRTLRDIAPFERWRNNIRAGRGVLAWYYGAVRESGAAEEKPRFCGNANGYSCSLLS